MSILIKGMDMPKENSALIVLIYSDGRVFTGRENDDEYSAVEVATPHGRLIDGDMLESLIYERISDLNYKADVFDILRIMQDMRTIIEAEEGVKDA